MTDRAATFLTLLMAIAAFCVGVRLVDSELLRVMTAASLLCLAASSLFFRWPAYISRYFDGVVERDAQRGVLSIRNLGMAIIVAFGILLLMVR